MRSFYTFHANNANGFKVNDFICFSNIIFKATESLQTEMKVTESQEKLVEENETVLQSCPSLVPPPETSLTPTEKQFLLHAQRGDCASLRR